MDAFQRIACVPLNDGDLSILAGLVPLNGTQSMGVQSGVCMCSPMYGLIGETCRGERPFNTLFRVLRLCLLFVELFCTLLGLYALWQARKLKLIRKLRGLWVCLGMALASTVCHIAWSVAAVLMSVGSLTKELARTSEAALYFATPPSVMFLVLSSSLLVLVWLEILRPRRTHWLFYGKIPLSTSVILFFGVLAMSGLMVYFWVSEEIKFVLFLGLPLFFVIGIVYSVVVVRVRVLAKKLGSVGFDYSSGPEDTGSAAASTRTGPVRLTASFVANGSFRRPKMGPLTRSLESIRRTALSMVVSVAVLIVGGIGVLVSTDRQITNLEQNSLTLLQAFYVVLALGVVLVNAAVVAYVVNAFFKTVHHQQYERHRLMSLPASVDSGVLPSSGGRDGVEPVEMELEARLPRIVQDAQV